MREFIRALALVSALTLASCSTSPVFAQSEPQCIDTDLAIARLEAAGAKVLAKAPSRFAKSGLLYFTDKGVVFVAPIIGDCVVVDVIVLGPYVAEVGI